MIEPGGEGVTAVANADESRTTEYYGTSGGPKSLTFQVRRALSRSHQIFTRPPHHQSRRSDQ
jgi:hypothetical protein